MNKLIRHLRFVNDVLWGRVNAKRGLTVFLDDVFVASYPRCGSTWMRFLIGNLTRPEDPTTFLNLESRVPDIYEFPDRVLRSYPRPRILRSHESFDPRYKRVVYLVRDPRDVAVSYYHFRRKWGNIPDGYPMDEFVPRYIEGEFEEWQLGACWGDHVLSWLGTRQGRDGFLLLRYEDMLQDPKRELAKVATLLKMDATPERLAQAVALSSSDRMRKLEKSEGKDWLETKRTRQDVPLIRSTSSGGWRKVLPEKSVAAIEEAWGPAMRHLGYELITEESRHAKDLDAGLYGLPLPPLEPAAVRPDR